MVVTQRDDSPPDMVNGNLKVTVTEYIKQKRRPMKTFTLTNTTKTSLDLFTTWMRTWCRIEESENVLESVFHTIPADGIVVFPIDTNSNVTKLVIKVTV